MAETNRFNALIVHPDAEIRSKLKELLHNEQSFGYNVYQKVFVVEHLGMATAQLSAVSEFDIIFLSNRFKFDEMTAFVRQSKERQGDNGIAHIIVLDADTPGETWVAQGLAGGADGMLVFPCSVENLREITAIATRVKKTARERMVEAALKLLVNAVTTEIDQRVDDFHRLGAAPYISRNIKAATERLMQQDDDSLEQFYNILMTALAEALPYGSINSNVTWDKYRARERKKARDDGKEAQGS